MNARSKYDFSKNVTRREDDPNAPVTQATLRAAIAELTNLIKSSQTPQPQAQPTPAAPTPAQPTPQPTPAAPTTPGLPPEVSAEIHRLKAEAAANASKVKALEDSSKLAAEKAEKAERENAIRSAMAGYQFTSDSARDSAYRLLELDIKREGDAFVGAGNLPLQDYVKDMLTSKHDYFLAPAPVDGAGAGSGMTRSSGSIGIEAIKQDMTPADRAAVVKEIGAVIGKL